MLMQLSPHDGVAALAESPPATATPPTRASDAAPASTLLLKDMCCSLLGTTAAPCARLLLLPPRFGPDRRRSFPACNRAEVTLIRAGTADLIGKAVLKGEDPGEPGNSRDKGSEPCALALLPLPDMK